MIQATLLAMLLATPTQDDGNMTRLTSRNLEVDGWYCGRDGCSSTSQDIDEALRFDEARSRLDLAKADTLPEDWTVIIHCRVTRRRLSMCRVASDTSTSAKATPIAKRLASAIRVVPGAKAGDDEGARAILSIMYTPGKCGWQCIPTSAPPAGSGK